MTTSYIETKELIQRVLDESPVSAREQLNTTWLIDMKRTEPEFCDGVIKHGPNMEYTSEQWFDFFSKIRNRLFWKEPKLMNKLSENQRDLLFRK